MQTLTIEPTFDSWRAQARKLLAEGVSPETTLWTDAAERQKELFGGAGQLAVEPPDPIPLADLRIPKAFLDLAKTAACHSTPERWGLLYRIAWRIARGGEKRLLEIATDSDMTTLRSLVKEVRRDCHKMRAFVRFRKVGESQDTGREQFVAWFEPDHHIVRLNAPFFRKRFTGMDWSILTPFGCVHWNGETLEFSEPVLKSEAPDDDALENLWRGYYRSIFNPARLKLKAMQAEMPIKYWKNLPEAALIKELTTSASARRDAMIDRDAMSPREAPKNKYLAQIDLANDRSNIVKSARIAEQPVSLSELEKLAACCRACPLWEGATQTVFGIGPGDAKIMLIGEQPGDQEDLIGKPFQGPAGRLLNESLEEAGLVREDLYITNAVKHFKWKPQPNGKRRLHDKASRGEMQACRPWLLGEITRIKPEVIVTLGSTAAQSVIRSDFRILSERGEVRGRNDVGFGGRIVATVHPSYLLRIPEQKRKREELARFVDDLKFALL